MPWLADRFFTAGSQWIDASSGRAVRIHVAPGEDDQLEWSERCARLSNLRHPLVNTLLDYGGGPQGCCFEAYDVPSSDTVALGATHGESALRHVAAFLRASGLVISSARGPLIVRTVVAGRGAWHRPIGLTIQARRALEALEESLDQFSPAGPVVVNVSGASHAGLRTLRTLAARSARLRGFVPVSAVAVDRFPALLGVLVERHVCVLDDVDEKGRSAIAVSRLIAALAERSTRRHVVMRFQRATSPGTRAIPLEPLSVRTLVGMVYSEGDPDEQELFAAARAADGLPGVFVARLGGAYRAVNHSVFVHERAAAYHVKSPPTVRQPAVTSGRLTGGRVLGAALRAGERAATLADRGRHSAAARVLERGIRVLAGRGRNAEAARCAMQLGWLALDRGAPAVARRHFGRAVEAGGDESVELQARVGAGVALTDEHRLLEAEAALRGALAAADTVSDRPMILNAAAALARCLMWQRRLEEAAAVIAAIDYGADEEPGARVRLLGVLARVQVRGGEAVAALRTARAAQRLADDHGPHLRASIELAAAEVLATVDDPEGAEGAIARALCLAHRHHLPLVRIRAVLISPINGDPEARRRLISRLSRLQLPPLLAHRVGQASAPPAPRPLEPVAELEKLLDLSQRAEDDASAAAELCRAVAERLGATTAAIFGSDDRALAVHGRGWSTMPVAARETLVHGTGQRPDPGREPQESAEPIRYGGDVIATITCRWPPGATIDPDRTAVLLRAAALSAAPHARALLDRGVAGTPGGLGRSARRQPGRRRAAGRGRRGRHARRSRC